MPSLETTDFLPPADCVFSATMFGTVYAFVNTGVVTFPSRAVNTASPAFNVPSPLSVTSNNQTSMSPQSI